MKKSYIIGGTVLALLIVVWFAFSRSNQDSQTSEKISDLIEKGEANLEEGPEGIPTQIASGESFKNEEEVFIDGYSGAVMEPGISKDGNYLLWNDGPPNKDMYWAARVDDTHFRYVGRVEGVNKSVVDGTPSFDLAGNLYYTSVVDYPKTAKSMWMGVFEDGLVSDVQRVDGNIYVGEEPWFSLDPDVSPDGDWLYYSEGYFDGGGLPSIFNVRAAKRIGNSFVLDESITKNINTSNLEYAPTISADGLEIFFTRTDIKDGQVVGNGIYTAKRNSEGVPFGNPERVVAIRAPFVEAPTISLDGRTLYYHKELNGNFKLYRVTR